jgi:hypothetical protein
MERLRPWGVSCIQDIYHPDVGAGLPDGRWVAAVCVPYPCTFFQRIRAAWWVLTGRAHAFLWPKAGDLEGIWQRKAHVVPGRPSRPFVPQADSKQFRSTRGDSWWKT